VIDVLELACRMRREGRAVVLATVVRRRAPSSGKPGCHGLVDAEGRLHGWVGGACAGPAIVREARAALREGSPRLVVLGGSEERNGSEEGVVSLPMSCASEGELEVFLEPLAPAPLLAVVGRSPAVETLSAMARVLGWRTLTLDGAAPDLAAAGVGEHVFVVVATQSDDDVEALDRALRTPAAYVGLVASRRRAAGVLAALRDRGVPEEALARVQAPAGLDLGPVSHPEIAVAILAELVRLRAAGERGAPARAALPPVTEAVDPVCGMTVDTATARHHRSHAGREYWFCAAGCQSRFEADPDRYATAAP
jgi:xanthine dehydrogenase accessory factor